MNVSSLLVVPRGSRFGSKAEGYICFIQFVVSPMPLDYVLRPLSRWNRIVRYRTSVGLCIVSRTSVTLLEV